jgi:2-polyprenyl-3-methyl-5-hydroxy-6-metoxy-1,4-benzoquinol methylase
VTRRTKHGQDGRGAAGRATAEASGWAALAPWYDAKQGDRGDLWHRALIDPTLLRAVGRVRGVRLLDLGCGNGYLSRHFARRAPK